MRGRLNYIELRVVTQLPIYERAVRVSAEMREERRAREGCLNGSAGGAEFIVRAFGYV